MRYLALFYTNYTFPLQCNLGAWPFHTPLATLQHVGAAEGVVWRRERGEGGSGRLGDGRMGRRAEGRCVSAPKVVIKVKGKDEGSKRSKRGGKKYHMSGEKKSA